MRALAVASVLLLAVCGCTPQQQATVSSDAAKAKAWVYGSCYIAQAASAGDPFVTVACALAEDIDGALVALGTRGITQVRIVCSVPAKDGGT